MKKMSIQIVGLLSAFLVSLTGQAQTFDFNALQGLSLKVNLPPNTNRMVDYQPGVIVGIHTHMLPALAQVEAEIGTYAGNVVLISKAAGFYVENVCRKKNIKTITMDVDYGVDSDILYIAVNGTNNFVPVSLGQTVTISGVQVTFPPAQAPGHQNFKGKVTLKGKNIRSVFIGCKTIVKELYVDNIDVR